MPEPVENISIVKVSNTEHRQVDDVIAKEAPLTIFVNDTELVTLLCSPENLNDLAVGFLFSEGVISSMDDIARISVNESKGIVWVTLKEGVPFSEEDFHRGRAVTSGCAKGQTFSHLTDKLDLPAIDSQVRFSVDTLYQLIKQMQHLSTIFEQTGCVHVAALFGDAEVLVCREDIGRHNAVDKVSGHSLIHNIDCSNTAMLVSGRLSSEMVLKAARRQIPILISRSAPTSSALKIADEAGMTLIGFARGHRMNIYSHPDRVVFNGNNPE
jgi:FdhD protein